MSEIVKAPSVLAEIAEDRYYKEFLRVPAMSAGMACFPRGATDHQSPHNEDEIYYVVRGRSKMCLGTDVRQVQAGDVFLLKLAWITVSSRLRKNLW